QLAFDEHLAIERRQRGNVDVVEARLDLELGGRLAQRRLDLALLETGGAIAKGVSRQVASQANASRDDNVGLRASAAQPLATGMSQVIQIHPWLPFVARGLAGER